MSDAATLLRIAGRVQGVGYRAWLLDTAAAAGLRGWVRNRRDGTVEALLIGEAATVDKVIGACRRGPSLAQVSSIDRSPAGDDGSTGFRWLPTA